MADACERELTVIACTGVEDELQDEVADCIKDFKDAGIKFWMLTGDLGFTAQEIGFNCGVMDRQSTALFKLEVGEGASLTQEVASLSLQIAQSKQSGKPSTVMISGHTFSLVQELEGTAKAVFLKDVLLAADSVIVFRSSPKQKADAVNLVKNFFKGSKVTMAIGDGFNDVNMIQVAQIGIGVRGAESSQAAAFADFAIAEFRDLRRLMFWHGRSFGRKAVHFAMIKLWFVWYTLWATLFNQAKNTMSAVNDVYGLFFALTAVAFVNFYVTIWVAFSHDVD